KSGFIAFLIGDKYYDSAAVYFLAFDSPYAKYRQAARHEQASVSRRNPLHQVTQISFPARTNPTFRGIINSMRKYIPSSSRKGMKL
ncbi:MAG: hypothetical protein P4M02_08895, partial [Clostridia bacterium]|nr:hypothetical protein [Clostridia bacterium]